MTTTPRHVEDPDRREPQTVDPGASPQAAAPGASAARIEEVSEPTQLEERVAELMERAIDVPVLASAVEEQRPPDAADTLETLGEEQAADVLEQMDDKLAAEALAEMEGPLAAGVLLDVLEEDVGYAARLLSLMAPDDAADLLQRMKDAEREKVLSAMDLAHAAALRRLVRYHAESAGGVMTTDYLALAPDMTVAQATESVRAREIPEGLQHLPVVAGNGRLVGILGLRDLLLGRHSQRVQDIMRRTVKAVRPDVDREQVAREFDRYDYTMMPVVDLDDRLVGLVTVDDIIDIIRAEQTEDVQKTVGASAVEAVYSPLSEKLRGRFPWLAVSLFLTAAASSTVLLSQDLVTRLSIIAYIMPLIAATVGNAGHQALAVTLRGIVLSQVRPGRVGPLIAREAAVGLLSGACLGGILCLFLGGLSYLTPRSSWQLGAVAWVALAGSMTIGKLAGACIPLIMHRTGRDPAHSSAIFLIMITDGISFATLLGLCWLLSEWIPAPLPPPPP